MSAYSNTGCRVFVSGKLLVYAKEVVNWLSRLIKPMMSAMVYCLFMPVFNFKIIRSTSRMTNNRHLWKTLICSQRHQMITFVDNDRTISSRTVITTCNDRMEWRPSKQFWFIALYLDWRSSCPSRPCRVTVGRTPSIAPLSTRPRPRSHEINARLLYLVSKRFAQKIGLVY